MKRIKEKWLFVCLVFFISVALPSCGQLPQDGRTASSQSQTGQKAAEETVTLADIPAYTDQPYVEIDQGEPEFTKEELTTEPYEDYGELDELGRCQTVQACVGKETMPTEERGAIGQVKPTGWHTVKYAGIDGNYLYNRCHLIGYQLTAENANPENLITGTRYMNTEGMLPFEEQVAEYVKETGNHVLYRVTPVFEEENLVASGVQMEAESVEDEGKGICFNVYVYNVQPDIDIDYQTGESKKAEAVSEEGNKQPDKEAKMDGADAEKTYVLNQNTYRFHLPDCDSVSAIKERNKKEYTADRETLIEQGYKPCGRCKP